jgi:glycosyltransferase involved in cell wall biosynthesis
VKIDKKNLVFPIDQVTMTGGMVFSVFELAEQLVSNFNIHIIISKNIKNIIFPEYVNIIYTTSNFYVSLANPIATFKSVFFMINIMKRFDPNNTIVITNDVGVELLFSVFGFKDIEFKRIFVSRGGNYRGKTGWFLEKGLRKVECIVATSEYQRNNLMRLNKNFRIELIHNGIKKFNSVNSNKKLNNNEVKISIIGYICENKNQMLAVQILKKLIDLGYNVLLNIYGIAYTNSNKLYEKKVINEINSKKLNQHVCFRGFVENNQTLYSDTDILISCSHSEGFGRVVVEAMSQGIPVVGNVDSGGLIDIIENDLDGYLVHNNVDSFVDKIILLIENEYIYKKISLNSLKKFKEKFSVQLMAQKYINILQKI